MKRAGKGLFISSIVMVLVVAVSLVTSTFAWFSSTAVATINNFDVTTKAAEGIQIASYNAETSRYAYGDLTLSSNSWEHAASGTQGWGTYLALTDGLSDVYAVSGDGYNMYEQAVTSNTQQNNKPKDTDIMQEATANGNFLVLNFALRNMEAGKADLVIRSITTTALTNEMAASVKIAFYMTDSAGESWAEGNESLLYVPYGTLTYDAGAYDNSGEIGREVYIDADAFEDDATYAGSLGMEKLATTWADKIKAGTLEEDTHYVEGTGLVTGVELKTGTALAPLHTLGTQVAVKSAIYVTMVVWFDGESEFSQSGLAGGGITIGVEFGTANVVIA